MCVCVCVCVCCKLTHEVEITLQELMAARKLIQILQEDVNGKPDVAKICIKEANSNHDLNFETAKIKLRSGNGINNNQLMHISVFIKNTLKVYLKFLLPRHVSDHIGIHPQGAIIRS